MKHIFRKKFTWLFTLALAALVVIPFAAFADNISNNIDGTVDATFEVMSLNTGGPNGSANLYVVPTDGDGKNGCNFQSHETLVVSVSSSSPSVATVSPSSVTFGSCGDLIPLTVIPGSAGSTDVTLSQTSNNTGDTFTLNTASFTVNVAPPSNTAPVVTVTGVTAGGSYEYGSVPAAGCSATDAEDGPQSVSPVIGPIIGPLADYGLGSQEVTCSYTDSGSLTTTASATYSIVDRQAPIISFVSRTPANGNGWNNGNVIVTWSCTDIGPGVVAASVSQTLSAEGANQSTTGTCEDHAGNTASDTQTGINIDKTAPTIAFVSRTAANSNGWNNGDVTLNWSCADSLSGPSAATVSETVSSEGANQSATGTCQDLADNTASDTQSGINIDTADPTLVFGNASPAANGSGWNNTNVSFSFTTGDNLSGVDTTNPASSPLVLTAEGPAVTGDVTVTDKAGNSHMFTSPAVKIDKTSPVITFSNRTLANGNGWNNSNVTVNWSCGDDLSGVVATPVSTTVDSEGTNMSATGTCADLAGNTASDTQSGINIDKTAPLLNITGAAGGAYDVCGKPAQPTFAPSDDRSGLDGSQGDSWTTPSSASGVGIYTYTAHAMDKAGNPASETRTYNVSYGSAAFSGFLQPINSDGSSRFKLTSTIPVKFALYCGSTPISNAVAKLYVAKGDNVADPGVDEAISTSASTTGNLFRYDITANQYIFNLSTKSGYMNPGATSATAFSTGTWTLKVLLDDGSWKSVVVQLPK